MSKKKLIKKMFKEFDRRYEAVTSLINKCDIQVIMLAQKVERVLDPYNKFVSITDFGQEAMRLRGYIEEVEHKVSHEFYNMVGLKKILRHEFANLIGSNREDIVKILEILKEREEEYDSSGSGIWRKK